MIRLNCFFEASNAATFQRALDAVQVLTIKSQKHDGCMSYDVLPNEACSDVFMICETWRDDECLAKHMEAPEVKTVVALLKEVGKVRIEKFEY